MVKFEAPTLLEFAQWSRDEAVPEPVAVIVTPFPFTYRFEPRLNPEELPEFLTLIVPELMLELQAFNAELMLVPLYLVTPSTLPVHVLPDKVTSPVEAKLEAAVSAQAAATKAESRTPPSRLVFIVGTVLYLAPPLERTTAGGLLIFDCLDRALQTRNRFGARRWRQRRDSPTHATQARHEAKTGHVGNPGVAAVGTTARAKATHGRTHHNVWPGVSYTTTAAARRRSPRPTNRPISFRPPPVAD